MIQKNRKTIHDTFYEITNTIIHKTQVLLKPLVHASYQKVLDSHYQVGIPFIHASTLSGLKTISTSLPSGKEGIPCLGKSFEKLPLFPSLLTTLSPTLVSLSSQNQYRE